MRVHAYTSGLIGLATLPCLVQSVNFVCDQISVNKHKYDFSKLGGDHSVHWARSEPPSEVDTIFNINICKNLARDKTLPSAEQCDTGTRICAVEYRNNTVEDKRILSKVVPIAGNYEASNGRNLDPDYTRFKDSASNSDSVRDGLRVELHGGRYPDNRKGTDQKAIIEFECDATRTGLEGLGEESEKKMRRAEKNEDGDDDDGEDDDGEDKDDEKRSLRFISYKSESDGEKQLDVLRLLWKTKYACDEVEDDEEPASKASHWGFFTWFLIILFLGVAAYLIFGSWLNYNRYGARGWDLLPHGDTIRDIPYLVSDWFKSCVNRVQGSGSRGGYAAV